MLHLKLLGGKFKKALTYQTVGFPLDNKIEVAGMNDREVTNGSESPKLFRSEIMECYVLL